MTTLEKDVWTDEDRYSLDDLNRVIQSYAQNDNRLKDLADSLMLIISSDPGAFPVDGLLKTPADLQTLVDWMYSLGSTAARIRELDYDTELPRPYQEIVNIFEEEPFASLLIGAKIKPADYIEFLHVFRIIRGMVYWVYDTPPYSAAPRYVTQSALTWTSISRVRNNKLEYLLVDGDGTPITVNGNFVYEPLPPTDRPPILLIEYWMNQLLVGKLRTLHRISAFEACVDTDFRSNTDAFGELFSIRNSESSPCSPGNSPSPQGSPWACLDYGRRMPCGFTQPGEFKFLRESVADFAHKIDVSRFVPNKIEHRLLMSESFVQTPFGLFRVPLCEINWADLIGDVEFSADDGDPIIFIGLQFTIAVRKRDPDLSDPIAEPATVSDTGYQSGITPLEKELAPTIDNLDPPTGAATWDILEKHGHQHGLLLSFIQTNEEASPDNRFLQCIQVRVKPYVQVIKAQPLRDWLADPSPTTLRDEIKLANQFSTPIDDSPEVTHGWTGRNILRYLTDTDQVTDWELDEDQIALVRASNQSLRTWETVLPLGVQLLKRPQDFNFNTLNGAGVRFRDGWAIRRISSVQALNETLIMDDAVGDPEDFDPSFVNTDATVYTAAGNVVSVNIVEKLDKLAFLSKGSAALISAGDVIVFDQRAPDESLNDVYQHEVNRRSWVDLRTNVLRVVDYEVSEDELSSPTAYNLDRDLSQARLGAAVADIYETMPSAVESMLRFHQVQKFWQKANDKYEVRDLRVEGSELQGFLVDYIKDYESNDEHGYAIGENILISWPEKEPDGLEVNLDRYQRRKILANKDRLVLKEVGELGVVPVLVKHLDAQEHFRFPLRVEDTLTFISERNFRIPSHTKLAGSFFLQPTETQLVDPTVVITLHQQRVVGDGTSLEFLGSVELEWQRASAFKNATGVFQIDASAKYSPKTQRLSIPYNQRLNFSNDEPGILTVSYVYFDLADIHPIFTWEPGLYSLQLSHLSEARAFKLAGGEGVPIGHITRLEGISVNGGQVYVRFNQDDAVEIVQQRGYVETDWVIRGLPWIVINSVIRDAAGEPIGVTFDAFIIRQDQTITTTIANEDRCKQVYLPCNQKYGWVDVTQSNIHTQALAPQETASARFGFYQKINFKTPEGALDFETIFRGLNFILSRNDVDYRFTRRYTVGTHTDFEYLTSLGVFRNQETGQRKGIVGLFKTAIDRETQTDLEDELDLSNFEVQESLLYFKDEEINEDWIPEFAGVLIAVRDWDTIEDWGRTKLAALGYWYAGHAPLERIRTVRSFQPDPANIWALQAQVITKDATRWRIGDLPNLHVYRDNTLLEANRQKDVAP